MQKQVTFAYMKVPVPISSDRFRDIKVVTRKYIKVLSCTFMFFDFFVLSCLPYFHVLSCTFMFGVLGPEMVKVQPGRSTDMMFLW